MSGAETDSLDAAERAADWFRVLLDNENVNGRWPLLSDRFRHEQDADGVTGRIADLIAHASRIERERFVDIVVKLIQQGRSDG